MDSVLQEVFAMSQEAIARRYFSRKQAAEYMGVSLQMLDKLIRGKRIRMMKVGRRSLIDKHDVDAFAETTKGS
jgi:excisionase family DNA binding protein